MLTPFSSPSFPPTPSQFTSDRFRPGFDLDIVSHCALRALSFPLSSERQGAQLLADSSLEFLSWNPPPIAHPFHLPPSRPGAASLHLDRSGNTSPFWYGHDIYSPISKLRFGLAVQLHAVCNSCCLPTSLTGKCMWSLHHYLSWSRFSPNNSPYPHFPKMASRRLARLWAGIITTLLCAAVVAAAPSISLSFCASTNTADMTASK